VRDARNGTIAAVAPWRNENDAWTLTFALPAAFAAVAGFAKFGKPRPGLLVFDRYGWQVVEPVGGF
jgi:hypothetical protein